MLVEIPEKLMCGNRPEVFLAAGSWVAGGAIRAWYIGNEKVSDIDVFATGPDVAAEVVRLNNLATPKYTSESADTYVAGERVIQVIKRFFPSPEETLKSFDYTLCCFCWDGERIHGTVEAIDAVHRKKLAVANIQTGFEFDTLRRAFKYARKGYWPCGGSLRDLAMAITNANLSEDAINARISTRWD